MKTRGIIILFTNFVFIHFLFSQSSVNLKTNYDSISTAFDVSVSVNIGESSVDSFRLYLVNYDSLKYRKGQINVNSIELADFEVSSFGNFKNHNNCFIIGRQQINGDTFSIKIWDEGKFLIIPVENGKKDFLVDKSFPIIKILKSINDEKDKTISPINDIIREKKYLSDYFYWYHYLIGLFLLILLALYLYFKYKKKHETDIFEVPVDEKKQLTSEQIALTKLVSIKQEKIWLLGKTKEYHHQLTQVLKEYLENKYGFQALEMNSTEVIENLKNFIENQRYIDIISDILHISDLIKFAKVDVEIDLNEAFLDKLIKLINELM